MSNQSDREGRIVVDGTVLGRAPILKKCDHCGGIADYVRVAEGYKAICGNCGMQTMLFPWPENAGQRWNNRESEHARVITTQEIVEFRAALTDDEGKTACWVETIEGELRAVVLGISTSMDGREVYECGFGDFWEREKIDTEGIRWRLWDKRPTTADMERGPWGVVAYRAISEAARAEAERIRREVEERRAAEAKALAERQRRCCNYCARLHREVIDERRKLANLVCAVDGHTITSLFAPACERWRDEREGEEQ